jgi:ribosomal protein S18 acetylase RimI-like enzyme
VGQLYLKMKKIKPVVSTLAFVQHYIFYNIAQLMTTEEAEWDPNDRTWKNKHEYLCYLSQSKSFHQVVDNEIMSAFLTKSAIKGKGGQSLYSFFNQGFVKPAAVDDKKYLQELKANIKILIDNVAKQQLPFIAFVVEDHLNKEKKKILRQNRFISLGKSSFMTCNLAKNVLVRRYEKEKEETEYEIFEINGDDERFKADEVLWFRFSKILVESSEFPDSNNETRSYYEAAFKDVKCGPSAPMRVFVGTVDNGSKIVSIGSVFYSDLECGIYNIVVTKNYRRKTYGTQMVLHCMAESLKDGYEWCCLQPTQPSEEMFKKLGFQPAVGGQVMVNAHYVDKRIIKLASWMMTNRFSIWYFGDENLNEALRKIGRLTFRAVAFLSVVLVLLLVALVVVKLKY